MNTETGKICIVLPVYNAESFLDKCIHSILRQTYKNWELILVDDGSKDASSKICDFFSEKYENIRTIHQENAGVSAARNRGIQEASGEFIVFVDSDDWVSDNMLELLTSNQKKNDADFTMGNANIVGKNAQVIGCYASENLSLNQDEFWKHFGRLYSETLLNSPWAKLYRTDIIQKNNLQFDLSRSLGEDLLFNLNYYQYCSRFCFFPTPIYYYRSVTPSSLTNRFQPDKTKIEYELLVAVKDYCNKWNCLDENLHYLNTTFFRRTYTQIQQILSSSIPFHEKKVAILNIINQYLPKSFLEEIDIVSFHNKLVVFMIRHQYISLLSAWIFIKNFIKH